MVPCGVHGGWSEIFRPIDHPYGLYDGGPDKKCICRAVVYEWWQTIWVHVRYVGLHYFQHIHDHLLAYTGNSVQWRHVIGFYITKNINTTWFLLFRPSHRPYDWSDQVTRRAMYLWIFVYNVYGTYNINYCLSTSVLMLWMINQHGCDYAKFFATRLLWSQI